MRDYLSSIVLLVFLPCLLGWGALCSIEKKEVLELEILANEESIDRKQSRLATESSSVERVQARLRLIRSFNETWQEHLSSNDILKQLDELSFKNTLAIEQKSVNRVASYPSKEGPLAVHQVKAKVSGQYPRIYRWLDALECACPHARMQEIEIQVEGSKTVLLLTMILPEL